MPKDLYETLEIDRGASQDDVKKAYFKAARTKHPDKGGSAEEFKEIQRAYETLSDTGRRQMYDMTGSEEGQGNPGMGNNMGGNPFEHMMRGFAGAGAPGMGFHVDVGGMFEQMFQGAPGAQGFFGVPMTPQQGPPPRTGKGHSKMHEINMNLMEFYKGRELRLVFNQGRFCYACKGDGVTSFVECGACGGRGFHIQQMQIQPGMYVQTRGTCRDCEGKCRKPGPICTVCSGSRILNREKTLDVKILPGMHEGHQFTFVGECSDQIDFAQPGDVILVLKCPDTAVYSWTGNDLGHEITVSWVESVTGFTRVLADHPSGTQKTIVWNGDILLNGAKLRGLGLGMPTPQRGGVDASTGSVPSDSAGSFGDLLVTVKVTQPDSGVNVKALLMQALTESQKTTAEGDCILTRV
jgi:DnaJ-class molecular chaperone